MTLALFRIGSALALAAAVAAQVGWLASPGPAAGFREERWRRSSRELRVPPGLLDHVPRLQLAALPLLGLAALWTGSTFPLVLAAAAAVLPDALLRRAAAARRARLAAQLDGTLTALAGALSATPNLADALESLLDHQPEPIRGEIEVVLAEVKLGRPLDDALRRMADRLRIPGLDAAVSAAITGRRSGGDLPEILRRTAAAIREMARLEGVMRAKTAEGRSQAWVMGLVPPVLIGLLHYINPGWLEPLWTDPIGWIVVGASALLELFAIVLVRRIVAVEI